MRKIVSGSYPEPKTTDARHREKIQELKSGSSQEDQHKQKHKERIFLVGTTLTTEQQIRYSQGHDPKEYSSLTGRSETTLVERYVCPRCGNVHTDKTYKSISGEFICSACKKRYKYPIRGKVIWHKPEVKGPTHFVENPDWIK